MSTIRGMKLACLCCVLTLAAGPRAAALTVTAAPDASRLERLAAAEVRRYVYLRTGILPAISERGSAAAGGVIVARKDRPMVAQSGLAAEAEKLGAQEFLLRTDGSDGNRRLWIIGGDDLGTLYGAYRFAERLGVRFGLDEDVIPDQRAPWRVPVLDETGKPRFSLRGLQPFHDFLMGPDWWNLPDYEAMLSQMAKLRMNFIGFHTYPSWNAWGPEANVWTGLPEDVDRKGNVRFAYRAGLATSRVSCGSVNPKPFPTSRYAAGAGLLFAGDEFTPDFMEQWPEWPKAQADCVEMFNRYGEMQKNAFEHARSLGVKVCTGTETPLGIPKELQEHLKAKGMDPADPKVAGRLYDGTFLRLMRKSPVDYYWLWTPEVWMGGEGLKDWEITTKENTTRDLVLADAAAKAVNAPFHLATCGWRLGTQADHLWADKRVPKSWAAASIVFGLGRRPVDPAYAAITGRSKWAIPWAEDDEIGVCDAPLWVERTFSNARDAKRYGCDGLMAIHWRTSAINANVAALSRASWDYSDKDPPDIESYWVEWGRAWFGPEGGTEAGKALQAFDGKSVVISNLTLAGKRSSDEQIEAAFAPLKQMEDVRPAVKGPGNRARYDFWLNLCRAQYHRAYTFARANRLEDLIRRCRGMRDPLKKRDFARDQVLPLRLQLVRSCENWIGSHVACADTPGDMGVISSFGGGTAVVTRCDEEIAAILGTPLPPECALRTAYTGAPRFFVPCKRSHLHPGESQEIRAFVLSRAKSTGVTLCWRPLGEGDFRKVEGAHLARQAYRVQLPPRNEGAVEYYLEGALEDGSHILWPASAPTINQTAVVIPENEREAKR